MANRNEKSNDPLHGVTNFTFHHFYGIRRMHAYVWGVFLLIGVGISFHEYRYRTDRTRTVWYRVRNKKNYSNILVMNRHVASCQSLTTYVPSNRAFLNCFSPAHIRVPTTKHSFLGVPLTIDSKPKAEQKIT